LQNQAIAKIAQRRIIQPNAKPTAPKLNVQPVCVNKCQRPLETGGVFDKYYLKMV
jgi:hypothetical protein